MHLEPGNRGEQPFLVPFDMISGISTPVLKLVLYALFTEPSPEHHQDVSSPGSDFISALSMTTELSDT